MTTTLEGGERSASRPGRSLPPGKTRHLLYRRLGGPQGRSGQVRKISPPPGFDPRTVQSVASRYTDWATRPMFLTWLLCKLPTINFTPPPPFHPMLLPPLRLWSGENCRNLGGGGRTDGGNPLPCHLDNQEYHMKSFGNKPQVPLCKASVCAIRVTQKACWNNQIVITPSFRRK